MRPGDRLAAQLRAEADRLSKRSEYRHLAQELRGEASRVLQAQSALALSRKTRR